MGHILYKVHVQVPTYLTRILFLSCRKYINLQLVFQMQNTSININIYARKAVKKIQGVLNRLRKTCQSKIYPNAEYIDKYKYIRQQSG